MSCRKTLDLAERSFPTSPRWCCWGIVSQPGNQLSTSLTPFVLFFPTHAGPLPEPVINGGMEEKVRRPLERVLDPSLGLKFSFEANAQCRLPSHPPGGAPPYCPRGGPARPLSLNAPRRPLQAEQPAYRRHQSQTR